jgi:hypothetical protein
MKIFKGHYIYYLDKHGRHIPGIVIQDKGEFVNRRYQVRLDNPDGIYEKKMSVTLAKLELQECKENIEITERHYLKNHLEKKYIVYGECYYCNKEIKTEEPLNHIHYESEIYDAGWRVVYSESYDGDALTCPDCIKEFKKKGELKNNLT